MAVDPLDKRLHNIGFATLIFMLSTRFHSRNVSCRWLISGSGIVIFRDKWARKHPKNLGKVSGGENPSLGLFNPHQFFDSSKS